MNCKPATSLDDLSIQVEFHVIEFYVLDEGDERQSANVGQEEAPYGMQKEKADKPFIVFLTYALSDPDTVVIVLSYAHLADGAVFGSGWFMEVTGSTVIFLFVHLPIVVFFILLDVLFIICLFYVPW